MFIKKEKYLLKVMEGNIKMRINIDSVDYFYDIDDVNLNDIWTQNNVQFDLENNNT